MNKFNASDLLDPLKIITNYSTPSIHDFANSAKIRNLTAASMLPAVKDAIAESLVDFLRGYIQLHASEIEQRQMEFILRNMFKVALHRASESITAITIQQIRNTDGFNVMKMAREEIAEICCVRACDCCGILESHLLGIMHDCSRAFGDLIPYIKKSLTNELPIGPFPFEFQESDDVRSGWTIEIMAKVAGIALADPWIEKAVVGGVITVDADALVQDEVRVLN